MPAHLKLPPGLHHRMCHYVMNELSPDQMLTSAKHTNNNIAEAKTLSDVFANSDFSESYNQP